LSNYRVIRLKKSSRDLQTNCVISFCFYLYLIFYVCAAKFDVTRNFEKFLVFLSELNKGTYAREVENQGVRSANSSIVHISWTPRMQTLWIPRVYCMGVACKALFSFQKTSRFPVISNFVTHAWSIKCRQNQILITQFTCNSRAESFESS